MHPSLVAHKHIHFLEETKFNGSQTLRTDRSMGEGENDE
jgi:hypothetical protein